MLRDRDIAATVAGAMVGAGIFISPGLLLRSGAPPLTILGLFLAAGFAATAGAVVLVHLARAMPGNGGPYRYLRVLHPRLPFLFNWSRFWVMQTGALAILALTATRFLAATLGVSDSYWESVVAMGLLAATAAINVRGLRTGARVQRMMTALKLIAILGLAASILVVAGDAKWTSSRTTEIPGGLGSWMLIAVFAFGGWTQVTFLAGETQRDLMRPVVAAILGVTLVYLLSVAAMLAVPGADGVRAAEAARAAYGDTGATVVSLIIAITVLGTLHTMTLTGPRLYEAATKNGDWWQPFARRNSKDVPATAIWFQAEWAATLIAFSLLAANAFVALIGAIGTAIWLFHAATALAWMRAKKSGAVTGRWLAPVLFFVATTFVVGVSAWQDVGRMRDGDWAALTSIYALAIIASGIPLAMAKSRRAV